MVDPVGLFVGVLLLLVVEDILGVRPRFIQLEGGIHQGFMVLVQVVGEFPKQMILMLQICMISMILL